ncbi:MAG TPA: hypothetical protein VGM37_13995 [Armatimonadota bacterium]|jgi:hypothetical protein
MLTRPRKLKTVFVNHHAVALADVATVRDAVRFYDRRFIEEIERDAAEVMDANGWPLELDAVASERQNIYVCLLPWAERASNPHDGLGWAAPMGD